MVICIKKVAMVFKYAKISYFFIKSGGLKERNAYNTIMIKFKFISAIDKFVYKTFA